jgi:hypothetical protein
MIDYCKKMPMATQSKSFGVFPMSTVYRFSLGMMLGLSALLALNYSPQLDAQEAKQDGKKDEKELPKKEESKQEESKKLEAVVLKDGKGKMEGNLKTDDDKDKVQKSPCKVYTVELQAKRNYKIDLVSKELDSFLRLEDADGKELAKDDDSGDNVNARIYFHCAAAGTYRIICTTFMGGTGPFSLSVQELPLPTSSALALKDGGAIVEGKLTTADGMDSILTRSFCKIYGVKLSKGKTYQIDMASKNVDASKDVDSFLRLENAEGKELAKDDDSGGGYNARLQFECPEDGDYRIIATTYAGGVGNFTLTVKEK